MLTKTDLAGAAASEAVVAALRRLNPDASLLRAADGVLDAEALLAEAAVLSASVLGRMRCLPADGPPDTASGPGPGVHGAPVEAFSLVVETPLDWSLFGLWLSMLLHRHGAKILSVKGILNVEGSPTPVALHGVQQLVHVPRHLEAWPDEDRRSKIVFIVREIDAPAIRRSLEAFQTAPSSKPAP